MVERWRGRRDSSEGVSAVVSAGVHEMSEVTEQRTRSRPGLGDKVPVIDCRRSACNRGGREKQSKPAAASEEEAPDTDTQSLTP